MVKSVSAAEARDLIRSGHELAFLDVREEGPYSRAQPLFAVNIPLSELELRVGRLVPRRSVPVLLFDGGQGLAERAAERLASLGYSDVSAVAGGLEAWRLAGGELFRDVNVPSKSFGEWVETHAHTPSIPADELKALIDAKADVVILDSRPFSEYRVMTIPGSISTPGAELVLRAKELAPSDDTLVVVNCAGRTRSIIGAQSLINSGLFKRVAALRNGTIGWVLAGLEVERGASRRAPTQVAPDNLTQARRAARGVAERAGVAFITADQLDRWEAEAHSHTLFRFDVRSPEEFAASRAPDFAHAAGGQLVQATDEYVGVQNARLVLADDDGVRAAMTASWLRQLGWRHVAVLEEGLAWRLLPDAAGPVHPVRAPEASLITAAELAGLLDLRQATVLDLSRSPAYAAGHIPGAWLASRVRLAEALPALPDVEHLVLTSPDGDLARFAAAELAAITHRRVSVLAGGTEGWRAGGFGLETGLTRPAVPADDIYKRPYEGTDSPRAAMQGYIDWELQLVDQIRRDATANFSVI